MLLLFFEYMKQELRNRFLAQRRQLDEKTLALKGRQIAQHLFSLPAFKNAKTIASFVDFEKEPPTRLIIQKALEEGKTVGIPHMLSQQELGFFTIQSLHELVPTKKGNLEPPLTNQMLEAIQIQAILVPGIVFDEKGFRLGFGKGFFDRALPSLKQAAKIGLAFEEFVVPVLPHESHDVALDFLVTEKKVRSF